MQTNDVTTPSRPRVPMRISLYVLLVGAAGILLTHLAVQAAMRAEMHDHQRVLAALTPMRPDDRVGIKVGAEPVPIPDSTLSLNLAGVTKGALRSSRMTDRAFCRGLRPGLLWSDSKRSFQVAPLDSAMHDWDTAHVLLGEEIAAWLKMRCEQPATGAGVERLVSTSPFDTPTAAYVDHDAGLLLIVTALPGRRAAFDQLVASAGRSGPLSELISDSIVRADAETD